MASKFTNTLLPTTMVGSYPRPHWYRQQLLGRDIRVAFKEAAYEEAYHDATQTAIHDQQEAGLDIVTDGQMYFDDYVGSIGSFCWYMYERIHGFEEAKEPHPSEVGAPVRTKDVELLADWGGVINSGPVKRGPMRLTDLYKIAARYATKPIKVSVGAGPINLAWHVYFQHYKDAKDLSFALAPIFNAEMKDLVAAGAKYLQIEDLGAWLPLFTGNEDDYKWIGDVIAKCIEGVEAKIAWHFCFGNAWWNSLTSLFPLLLGPSHRSVRTRLCESRDGRHRVPGVVAEGQRSSNWRARRPHQHDRIAGAGCRPDPQGPQSDLAGACVSEH